MLNVSVVAGVHGANSFVVAFPLASKYVTSPVTALIFALRVNVKVLVLSSFAVPSLSSSTFVPLSYT